MSFERAARKLTQRVMHAVGSTVTVRRITVGNYAPATGTVAVTPVDQAVAGQLDDYVDREFSDTVKAGDRKLFLAAADLDWVPVQHDRVIVDGTNYDVVSVRPYHTGNSPAMLLLQIRR